MRPDEYDEPQQVSGHYGLCLEPGHPSACPSCSARWAQDAGQTEIETGLETMHLLYRHYRQETAMPAQIIPDAQAQAFHRALAERLGLDLSQIIQIGADVSPDGATITWTGKAELPADEVTAMMNLAAG